MTNEEAIQKIKHMIYLGLDKSHTEACEMAIKALEQEACEDCISRQAALDTFCLSEKSRKYGGDHSGYDTIMLYEVQDALEALPSVNPQEPKTGYCKDCKWWKDSDGVYRRGIGAESQCPMNRIEVIEGNGYCYMFEPQESEDKG